jgi:hypothetical protein
MRRVGGLGLKAPPVWIGLSFLISASVVGPVHSAAWWQKPLPPMNCWLAHRTDHPHLTVNNTTPMTVVAARATRKFGVNRCRYVPAGSTAAPSASAADTKESIRRFVVDVTLHNPTSAWYSARVGCKFYDAKGAYITVRSSSWHSINVKPGGSLHQATCEFDPQLYMLQGEPIPSEWPQVVHTFLFVENGSKG